MQQGCFIVKILNVVFSEYQRKRHCGDLLTSSAVGGIPPSPLINISWKQIIGGGGVIASFTCRYDVDLHSKR